MTRNMRGQKATHRWSLVAVAAIAPAAPVLFDFRDNDLPPAP